MDYLDVNKERRHNIILLCGYVLIGAAIAIATLVLLYQAYGFGLSKNGTVVQNGLIFFSSKPSPASIYTNGRLQPVTTNTRMTLPAGIYDVKLRRDGYQDWQRKIEIEGGGVQHFDYPFLVPNKLDTRNLQSFPARPGLLTPSPDRRWVLMQTPESISSLQVYDLRNPDKEPLALRLPQNLLASPAQGESWQPLAWADNNKHVLLRHVYDDKSEYILIDRTNGQNAVNLTRELGVNPAKLEFKNRKYDRYLAYDPAQATLRSLRLGAAAADEPVFQRVLAYKSYGDDTLLYVTDSGAPADKVLVKLSVGVKTYNIRQFSKGGVYSLDLTKYSGDMYVVAASSNDNRVYVYKDPAGQLANTQVKAPGPQQVMYVQGVNHVSFSASAQFVMAENGNHFGVYDLENKAGYNYQTTDPIDPPATHATWMDGNRLMYVSQGRLVIFDYDNLNRRLLGRAIASYEPAFDPDFEQLYLLAPGANGQFVLSETQLLAPADR